MKIILLVLFFLITLIVISLILPGAGVSAQSERPVASTEGDLLAALADLFKAAQEILTLLADFTIQLINTVYLATPLPLRCLFGLALQIGGLLSLVGLVAIRSGAGFWRRHF